MSRASKHTKIGETLRSQGLVMLPPLWIQAADMPQIHELAGKATEHVNEVRKEHRKFQKSAPDPTNSKEDAWEQFEKLRELS
jgi:hypothetical protein